MTREFAEVFGEIIFTGSPETVKTDAKGRKGYAKGRKGSVVRASGGGLVRVTIALGGELVARVPEYFGIEREFGE